MTDFGLCKEGMEQEETTSTFCGTPEVQHVLGFHCDLGAESLQRLAALGLRLAWVLSISKYGLCKLDHLGLFEIVSLKLEFR